MTAPPEPPGEFAKFLGYMMMAIGGLFALLFGLCTLTLGLDGVLVSRDITGLIGMLFFLAPTMFSMVVVWAGWQIVKPSYAPRRRVEDSSE